MTVIRRVLCFKSHGNRKYFFTLAIGILIGYLLSEFRSSDSSGEPLKAVEMFMHRNNTLKLKLIDEVRVLCWVLTSPDNLWLRARHIERTWGKRCNKLLIMSSKPDDRLSNVIALPVGEGRDSLWDKTKEAFKYIYMHHMNEYDWFFKADDDTYAIIENLRFMLYPYSPSYPVYFGCRFRLMLKEGNMSDDLKEGYMSGGAGYVLSKTAVIRFVEDALTDGTKCRQDADGAEDAELAKCLTNVGVITGDSRDSVGLGRFFPLAPFDHLVISELVPEYWYWHSNYYKTGEGVDAVSDFAISFHYIYPKLMYVLEFFIYHLMPFGIVTEFEALPKKLSLTEMYDRLEEAEKDKVVGELYVPEVDPNDVVENIK